MSWRDQAACTGNETVDWFPEFRGDRVREWRLNLALARQVCDGCPVKCQCLVTALEDPHTAGIWAGTTESQRRRWPEPRKRRAAPRGEPRCGTPTGYRRHRYLGEPSCQACREAHAMASRVTRHMLEVVR